MIYFQYIEDLYDSYSAPLILELTEWLNHSVGCQGNARDDIRDWAWSMTTVSVNLPRGIYFARSEDQVAFRIKFNIGFGRFMDVP